MKWNHLLADRSDVGHQLPQRKALGWQLAWGSIGTLQEEERECCLRSHQLLGGSWWALTQGGHQQLKGAERKSLSCGTHSWGQG